MSRIRIPERLAALLFACALLLFCAPSPASAEAASSSLDRAVVRAFRQGITTGGMVVAAKDGKIVYKYCYGYASQDRKLLVTEDSYFRLASVSKLVTAAAVMRLAETGQLDLDENIGRIIGGDRPYNAANPAYEEIGITPRMLMSHTSSLRKTDFAQNKLLRDALQSGLSYYPKEKPGTAYHYSNEGAGIMGVALEAVTGTHLSEAVSTLIFDRMGIDAAYSPGLLRHPENITSDYSRDYSTEIDLEHDYDLSFGGCWMKGEDLCRIGIMLCDYGMYEGTRILEEATVREMLSSQQGKGGITVDSPFGLNVERMKNLVPGRIIYGHQGYSNIGNSEEKAVLCLLLFDPDSRFVFAMVTNACYPIEQQHGLRLPGYTLFRLLREEFSGR